MKFLCWHTGPSVKARDPQCPHMSLQLAICFPLIPSFPQQGDWVVSCWNSHSSSSVCLVCTRSLPLAAVCTVPKESWLTRQVRYVKNKTNYQKCLTDATWQTALSWLYWWWKEPRHLAEVLWTSLWGPDTFLPCTARAKSGSERGSLDLARSAQEVSKNYVCS